jgi:pimeloyl-ACP methyl ester carboxylesterase
MTPTDWQALGVAFPYHDHEIFLRMEGNGPDLLLIHGFPTSSWDWYRVWPNLIDKFRVIAPDMIGFGFSDKPRDYHYSILDQADLHEAILQRLQIKEVQILCHDYGVTVTQELLARQNEGKLSFEIDSVIFLNGGLFPETHRPRLIQKLLNSAIGPYLSPLLGRKGFARTFNNILGPNTQANEKELDEFWNLLCHKGGNRILHKLITYMPERVKHRERWVGALQEAQIPMRVINGPEDPVSGRHMTERYKELVPNPDVVWLEGIGHYPQVENPEGVINAALAFWRRLNVV